MRQSAQRTIEMQNNLPADVETAGFPTLIGGQAAIDRAFAIWQKKRGMPVFSSWKNRVRKEVTPTPERPKKAPTLKKVASEKPIKVPRDPRPTSADAKAKIAAKKKAWRLANKERVRESGRAYQQRRRDAMTPEQRAAECKKINDYRKLKRAKN